MLREVHVGQPEATRRYYQPTSTPRDQPLEALNYGITVTEHKMFLLGSCRALDLVLARQVSISLATRSAAVSQIEGRLVVSPLDDSQPRGAKIVR